MIGKFGSAWLLAIAVAVWTNIDEPAYACTPPGPEFDAVALSDVIVEGRILGYEALIDGPAGGDFVPVRVDMDVERVFKGDVAVGPLAIVDPVTLIVSPSGEVWAGSSGACGAFDEDPTGKYVIIGLNLQDDGTYSPHRLLFFFYGDAPNGADYDAAVAHLTTDAGASSLPDTGSGPEADRGTTPWLVLAGVSGAVILVSCAAMREKKL